MRGNKTVKLSLTSGESEVYYEFVLDWGAIEAEVSRAYSQGTTGWASESLRIRLVVEQVMSQLTEKEPAPGARTGQGGLFWLSAALYSAADVGPGSTNLDEWYEDMGKRLRPDAEGVR